MVPAEFVAQDHAYKMLKLQLAANAEVWRDNVNIVALSEMLSLSRTPVREAIFRLVGEGIVEPADHGGYRLFRPDAEQLRDLYAWLTAILSAALGMIAERQLREIVGTLAERDLDPHQAPWALFQSLADATQNREFSAHVRNAMERLISARAVERAIFAGQARETAKLLSLARSRVRSALSRKIDAYFLARIEQCEVIATRLLGE